MADNRVFSVNGEGEEMLLAVLKLAFMQEGDNTAATGWKFSKTKGLILYQYPQDEEDQKRGINAFPTELDATGVMPMVWQWLQSKQAGNVKLEKWDRDEDHDGSNGPGFRVYCDDWGQIEGEGHEAFLAITPAFMWYGK